jgi:hypothetical protein
LKPRLPGRALAEAGAFLLLTWIAVGILDGRRGLWQDDAQVLFRQFAASGPWWERLFLPYASPARRLVGLPYQLALWTPWPLTVLYGLLAAGWLATGLLARLLAVRLWPALPQVGFLACVLTLTATSDFFTSSLVALHYVLSIVAALGALVALVDWSRQGGAWRLALMALGLVVGFLQTDTPLSVLLFGPLVLLAAPPPRRRLVVGLVVWYLAAVPYLLLVLPAAFNPSSYLSHAMQAMPWSKRVARLADLVAYNVTPWRWSSGRPLWFPREGQVMAFAPRLALAALGALGSVALFVRGPRETAGEGVRGGRAAAVLALLAVAANGLFASVALSEFYCRTHLLSRVWVSLLLAAGLAWCATRGRGLAFAAAAAGAWIALGLLGGLERQDYFAGHWRRHQAELQSLRAAAPALAPDARVLLRVPARSGFVATDAGYLARAWMTLLHADPTIECRVVLWADGRPTACDAAGPALVCRGERSPDCVRRDGRREDALPIDRLVWLDYDPQRRRFALRSTLPAGLDPTGAYAPAGLVSERPAPALTRALMDRPLGSFQ